MKLSLVLVATFVQLSLGNDVPTRFNPEFNCPGCQLITTEESLRGTISQGPTTITTYTPPIVTTSNQDIILSPIISPTTNTNSLHPPLTTGIPPQPPVDSKPHTDIPPPTFTSNVSHQPTDNLIFTVTPDPFVSTIIIDDTITKTFIITTSTALILLVTETLTYTEVETITQNHPYVDHEIFTTRTPVTTYTTLSNHGQGYFNITDLDEYYKEFLTTEYSTFETTHNLVRERYELTFFTRILEKVITSTLIVWHDQYTQSYVVEDSYYTTISTITPGTYITTITPSSASETTQTVTVTVTPVPQIPPILSTTSNVCATIQVPNNENELDDFTPKIFSGYALKKNIPSIYYFGFFLPLLL